MPTTAQYLIDSLSKAGVDTVFGIPGDYVLNLYSQFDKAFNVVNTIDEQGAGFAADAYARCRPGGIGVVLATYGVGGLKLANAIACAYAEKSPVIFISGAPGLAEQKSGMQLHHMVGSFKTQHNVFKHLTKTTVVLDDPNAVGYKVESAIDAAKAYSMPAYIEIPRDIVDKQIRYDVFTQGNPDVVSSDEETLYEAMHRSIEMIDASKKPVILAGVEVARFNFGKQLIKFAESHNIPVATTPLSKSVIDETHPLSLGVYCGVGSKEKVRDYVESSDCVIKLGVFLTDMNLGFKLPRNPKSNEIFCTTNTIRVKLSTYTGVTFPDFMTSLLDSRFDSKSHPEVLREVTSEFIPENRQITSNRLFEKINSILDENMAIIADVGDSLFGSTDLTVHYRNQFLAPAYYTSMGFAVPAAVGVCCARQHLRPIVVVGDGAFQMTGMEVSTLVKNGMNPIVIVLNNKGYLTERFLGHDGQFNDVQMWQYHKIPDIIGGGKGYLVENEMDLEKAVAESLGNNEVSIINVILETKDATPALLRMTSNLRKVV